MFLQNSVNTEVANHHRSFKRLTLAPTIFENLSPFVSPFALTVYRLSCVEKIIAANCVLLELKPLGAHVAVTDLEMDSCRRWRN